MESWESLAAHGGRRGRGMGGRSTFQRLPQTDAPVLSVRLGFELRFSKFEPPPTPEPRPPGRNSGAKTGPRSPQTKENSKKNKYKRTEHSNK